MAPGLERTRRKAALGRYMRALRERCDPVRKPEEIAAEIRTARSTITRMESGYTAPGFLLMSTLLAIYGASDDERREAVQLWEDAKQSSARLSFEPADRPAEVRTFYRAEAEATKVINLAPQTIPGLFQIPDYVRAVSGSVPLMTDKPLDAEAEVKARLGRQKRLTDPDPVHVHALIDVSALMREVGGPSVRRAQLEHLLALMRLPHVTIQAIPHSAGAYGAMSGAITLLQFPDPEDPAAVYLQYPGGGTWVEDQATVARFERMIDQVADLALSPKDTAKLIRRMLEE